MAILTEYYVQLINSRTGNPIDDDSGLYNVLTASDPTEVTIYSSSSGASGSNPGTMTNGIIQFWTGSSTTSVDISVLTASGRSYFIEGLTPSQHRVEVDTEKTVWTLIVPFSGNTACDAVADTGFDLVAGTKVKDVFIHVTTITTATAIDVGISGDTDGFFDAAVTSATGFKQSTVTKTSGDTSLSYADYIKVTQTRGLLIVDYGTGLATACTGGEKGFFTPKPYIVTAATSLVYVVKETNSGGTGEGYIYVEYELLPTSGN